MFRRKKERQRGAKKVPDCPAPTLETEYGSVRSSYGDDDDEPLIRWGPTSSMYESGGEILINRVG